MKKQIITASLLTISYLSYSQMVSTPTLPAPLNDGVVSNNGLFNRIGHYQFNILHPYNSGWATWSTLGDIIPSGLGNTPNDPSLYGLTVNRDGDRCFFGMRNNLLGVNQGNQSDAIVAWGDDNWANTGGNPDRMLFEFHDSNAGAGTNIREAMTLMPNPASNGVWVGVNQHTPGNTMEINSTQYTSPCLTNGQPQAPSFGPATGWAGLRFTDLTSNCTPQLNPGNGVLSVNGSGDVIYVPSSTFGNLCGVAPANALTNHFQIPLGGFRYHFTGQAPTNTANNANIVAVGYPCTQNVPSRFSVLDNQGATTFNTYAGHFKNDNLAANNNHLTAGIYAEAKGAQVTPSGSDPVNAGSVFEAWGTTKIVGSLGRIANTSVPNGVFGPNRYAIGGAFISELAITNNVNPAIENIGVYGRANNSILGNIGVYGEAPVGINNWAGYFNGDVYCTTGNYASSDKRYKREIEKIESVMDKITKLSGYTYYYNTNEFKSKNFSTNQQIGFIAQEVKEVFPQLIKEDKEGYLAINYQGMIPVLLEGLKEQQKQIDELKEMVKSLANAGTPKDDNSRAVNLSDKNVLVLNQNVPNPFAESTVITYNIPTDFTKAQLIFTTSEGKVINTVEVTTKGEGRLNVFANDLSSGMYSYTLVVDGKTIDTKKMVKQ